MNLVFMYGPPAAGKLTVANALATLTGYKVFHNHAALDLASSVLPTFSNEHSKLVEKIRIEVIDAAARAGTSLITTLVYGHPDDLPFVRDVEAVLHRAGGRVWYVQLCPSQEELEQRVVAESRAAYDKLRDIEGLRRTLNRWDLVTPIPGTELSIDNTDVPADLVAAQIFEHLQL